MMQPPQQPALARTDRAGRAMPGATSVDRDCHVAEAWRWFDSMGRPLWWSAPMVGHSEPAFRMLVRQHGVGMCSTEMIDSGGYVRSESYRRQFEFPLGDRPLIVQLVGVNRPIPRCLPLPSPGI